MTKSFSEDLLYLAKVTLVTFFLLSLMVIYNQKLLEGIILLTFVCQLLLVWILVEKYDLNELLKSIANTSSALKNKRYLHLVVLAITFVAGFFYLFRAIVIAQQSLMNHGFIKSNLYTDIMIAGALGAIILVTFLVLYFVGNNFFKKSKTQIMLPTSLLWLLIIMWNIHISHNF